MASSARASGTSYDMAPRTRALRGSCRSLGAGLCSLSSRLNSDRNSSACLVALFIVSLVGRWVGLVLRGGRRRRVGAGGGGRLFPADCRRGLGALAIELGVL